MRTIGVVTTSRADYGILLPVLRRLDADPELELRLIVSGTHLAPEFGFTIDQIERDGLPIAERLEMLLASDSPLGIAKSMGLGTLTYADAFARNAPDILFVTGDRFEMHAAAVAALPFTIPVAHLHGGESTAGAIDDALRHSLTKLSHIHFTATTDAYERVVQLGEEPWRVTISGAPSLDNILALDRLDAREVAQRIGMPLTPAPILATLHPVTLQHEHTASHVEEFLAALDASGMPTVFTLPNADTSGRIIRRAIQAYVSQHPDSRIADNLGTQAYFSLMQSAAAMVGNSSSGIIEAASFGLPVVNVGDRQAGRLRGRNVIDSVPERTAIGAALRRACSAAFRAGFAERENPYGRGNAAAIIVERLRSIAINERLLVKHFHTPPYADVKYG